MRLRRSRCAAEPRSSAVSEFVLVTGPSIPEARRLGYQRIRHNRNTFHFVLPGVSPRRTGASGPKSEGARERPRRLRVALLSYRSKPHCGGQGVYVRHLSRELANLGHEVEVFSGQPYPELDPDVRLTKVPSLDLYREPDPFRVPRLREFRDLIDVREFLTMCLGGFPEPRTFSRRVARLLADRVDDFDVVHDNQVLGYGMLDIERLWLPMVTTVHHPITFDRRIDLEAAPSLRRKLAVRRWYGFLRMQGKVVRQARKILTPSEASRRDIARDFGVDPARMQVILLGVDDGFVPPSRPR